MNVRQSLPEAGKAIEDAMPKGWYAGNLTETHDFARWPGDEDTITFSVEFMWGTAIEGGRLRHYVGGTGRETSARTVTLSATGASIEDLVAVAKVLPDLERLASLPWPIEFNMSGYTR